MKYPKDLKTVKFGRLSPIKFIGIGKFKSDVWECLCDCGNIKNVVRNKLVKGNTKSCGCLRTEKVIERNFKHGLSSSRFYNIYRGILKRCNDQKHHGYKNYGGRGIKCEWNSFEEFRNDMFSSYEDHVQKHSEKNTSIDRIDVNKGYFRENCKWSTMKEQNSNKRNKKKQKIFICDNCKNTIIQ